MNEAKPQGPGDSNQLETEPRTAQYKLKIYEENNQLAIDVSDEAGGQGIKIYFAPVTASRIGASIADRARNMVSKVRDDSQRREIETIWSNALPGIQPWTITGTYSIDPDTKCSCSDCPNPPRLNLAGYAQAGESNWVCTDHIPSDWTGRAVGSLFPHELLAIHAHVSKNMESISRAAGKHKPKETSE